MLLRLASATLIAAITLGSVLITPEEAERPPAQLLQETLRGAVRAPGIEQIEPAAGTPVASPFHLKLRFLDEGAVVDASSVQLSYLKHPPVDLTSRVSGFVGADGIDMPQAEAPPGEHQLRVRYRDSQGRIGFGTIRLTVLPH
ncbi:MAG: hypothetical protein JO305_04725 [Alphaproteobacteria bacterium]|nr:hypothetical protein [Alphaproteobacteria bacterium]